MGCRRINSIVALDIDYFSSEFSLVFPEKFFGFLKHRVSDENYGNREELIQSTYR
jgi:hypothetical protein